MLSNINSNASTDTTNLGAASSAISCNTGDECANLVSTAARLLDEADVPEDGRWCVAPPQFYEILRQADAKLMDASVTGESMSSLMNGAVTARKVHGFTLYQSNAIAVGSTGSDSTATFGPSSTSGETNVLFGHMSAVATASHIAKTEVVRDPNSFADIVRGLHVFGRKVLRPSGSGFIGVYSAVPDLNT